MNIGTILLIGTIVILAVVAPYCAYYNGVNDGYGACVDPDNPGYQKALRWLKKNSNVYKVHN